MASANPLLRCFGFYRERPWLLVWATLGVAVVNAAAPLTQYVIGLALHEVETGRAVARLPDGSLDLHRAWGWAWILLAIAGARGLTQYFSTVLVFALGQRLLHSLRAAIFRSAQALDLAYHQRHGAGELINRATRDSDKVRDAVVGGYRTLLELVVLVLANLGLLWWYDWRLAAVPCALVAVAVVIGASHAQRLVEYDRRADAAYDQVAQELSEGVHGVRVIKAFALERRRVARFVERVGAFAAAMRSALGFTSARMPLPQLVVACGHPWLLGCGAWLVAQGALNRGELVAAMMAMQALIFRIEPIGRLVRTFADARASAGRVVELLDARPAIVDGAQALPAAPLALRVEGVGVRDAGGTPILDGLDLTVAPGELVALVGATGSGKSTLAALLPRLRDPDQGRVLLGGVDLRALRLRELRRAAQVVYQDSFLFSDSLAANLRLAAPGASDQDLRDAIAAAAAEDVLAALPDGLASRIGERGVTLSGGQRQRLCIARALLARPAVLCLDDATSALDALTERRVLEGLRARRGCAVLLIASKLSTIRQADRVLLLEGGRIAAAGTHDELIESSRAYRDLLGLEAAA